MFKKLFDFSYQRSFKEAFGFYLFYFFIGVLIALINALFLVWISDLGGVFDTNLVDLYLKSKNEFDIYLDKIANVESFFITFFMCFILSIMFIVKKKLKNKLSIFLFILSLILSFSDILALIPVAILSTFPNKNISE